jgi:hypothetical protein
MSTETCIWCEGGDWKDPKDIIDAEEIDYVQSDSGEYDDCDSASWGEYECPVCGCIFRIGGKCISFNEIIKEGDNWLKVKSYEPISYSSVKTTVEAKAKEIGLTKELYDKEVWFVDKVPRHPGIIDVLYGLYVLEWYTKEHKLWDKMWG